MTLIRLLLLDDHPEHLDELAVALDAEPRLSVIARMTTTRRAVAFLELQRPEVALVAAPLDDGRGIDVAARFADLHPGLNVVVVAAEPDSAMALRAVMSGASGFVVRTDPTDDLVRALVEVAAGETFITPRVLTDVFRRLREGSVADDIRHQRLRALSLREREVLQQMLEGRDATTIATRLFLSPHTVRTHIKHILAKLHVHSSLEAVSVALRAGLRPSPAGSSSEARSTELPR